VATAYYAGVLAFAWRPPGPATLGDVLRLVLAGAGLWALAYLAGSLGALGTDPFAQEQRHRLKPAWVYLFLAVASAQGLALSREAAWIPLAAVVLVATLAWALWRKAGRSLPLLLDPVARP
jgi:chromate transport protein ChrA